MTSAQSSSFTSQTPACWAETAAAKKMATTWRTRISYFVSGSRLLKATREDVVPWRRVAKIEEDKDAADFPSLRFQKDHIEEICTRVPGYR